MTMQNTVTSADADWSGMSEDETMTNCNALKPERSRTFLEIVVSYPVFCAYPEYEGKPYYAIKYEEKDEIIIGFGTYKPEVLSQYLREYFLPFTEPERKTKIEMNWTTYFDNMGTAVIHIPYSYKCGNCGCQLQRAYDEIDINYCPKCGYKLEWK